MLSTATKTSTSHFRPPTSRRALTLAEVLIAMGLLTIGLLGVASIFPVGGYYMQSGDIADRAGAVAEAALEDAMVRGYLDPERWVVHDASVAGATSGRFISYLNGDAAAGRIGLRTAVANVSAVKAQPLSTMPALSILGQNQRTTPDRYTARLFGGAIVLDPIGMTAALGGTDAFNAAVQNPVGSVAVRRFPASPPDNDDMSLRAWPDWFVGPFQWPVRRATPIHSAAILNDNSNANNRPFNKQLPAALNAFTAPDDLAITLPENGDDPALGLWDALDGTTGRPSAARLSNRDFSWILSIAPESTSDRDAIAFQPDAYPVEVSAVVFHKRAIGTGLQSRLESERLVNARLVSTGPGGGEMLLTRRTADSGAGSPFENLRVGQYVMVTGPHPLSNAMRPMLALKWCRVLSIEDQGPVNLGTGTVQLSKDQAVLVSLRGPDWPWTDSTSAVANNLRVGILPGAVAVHTKTMRLEAGTEWAIE